MEEDYEGMTPDEDDYDDSGLPEHVEAPDWMSANEYINLVAIYQCVTVINRPTFQSRLNWKFHERLVRRKFITWKKHPDMGRGFAAVDITDKGRELVKATT